MFSNSHHILMCGAAFADWKASFGKLNVQEIFGSIPGKMEAEFADKIYAVK